MSTAVTTTAPQAPWKPAAERLLSEGFSLTLLSTISPTDRAEARAWLGREMTPLCDRSAEAQNAYHAKIVGALVLIATKINPTMSEAQAGAWAKVVAQALNDLPGRIALVAVRKALREPIRFFPEVDGKVREIAADVALNARVAFDQLDYREPALPSPTAVVEPAEPLDLEQTRQMLNAPGGADFVKIGLTLGMIRPEHLDTIRQTAAEAA